MQRGLNAIESYWIILRRRVPQGTILRPLLFNKYVSDLAKILEKKFKAVQFRDPTFLFISDTDEL